MSTPSRSGRPLVISCAFALAEAYFGVCDTDHAQLLLTGRIDMWSGYWQLDEDDRRRVGDLLRHRGDDLASLEVFNKAVRELGSAGELEGYRLSDNEVNPLHGLPPRTHADRLLAKLADLRNRPILPTAKPGRYLTTLRSGGSASAEAAYDLSDLPNPQVISLPITTAPHLQSVEISVDELRKMAGRIDVARGESHRQERVDALFAQLIGPDGQTVTDSLRVQAGGVIDPLIAPTGFGKTVLLEVLGTLAAEKGIQTALVVPSRVNALSLAFQIQKNLTLLGITGSCTPLVSPKGAMKDAEKIAAAGDSFGDWAYDRLAYGCALSASTETEEGVDAWSPGHEPCRDLRLSQRNGRRHACPWRGTCGKFRLMRDAVSADVIVTAHATFCAGSMHIPLATEHGVSDQMSVEEFLLRRCQLVVVDEVDQFQRSVIDKSARHLDLAKGRQRTHIHRLDDEFRNIFGHVLPESDGEVRAILSDVRLLSEHYIANLVKEWIPPVRPARRGYRIDHWLVPRGNDAWITARLLGLPADGRRVTQDEVEGLQALFAAPNARPVEALPLANLTPDEAAETRVRITASLMAISAGCRVGTLMPHKVALSEALQVVVPDEKTRGMLVDRLIRRAHLEPLRRKLSELFYHTPHLRALGAEAAETIADALGGFTRWDAMPASPLGRLFFAFKERFDAERPEQTTLSVAAFGGDPHGYVRYLGELTARGHARVPRAVLGLSATCYFPGAPHHHVLTEPTWFVPDTDASGVTIHDARVFTTESAVRISGVQGRQRESNLAEVGEGLYRLKLVNRLRDLVQQRDARNAPGRDRILVATTSYDSVLTLAEGMVRAGAPKGSLCLLARSEKEFTVRNSRWHVLPADQVEHFPSTGAEILIAPLAVVERGANILDGGMSALGAIYMVVRPVPVLDEPAELLAHINHRLWSDTLKAEPNHREPLDQLEHRMRRAGQHFEEIVRSAQYFRSLPEWVQLGVVAEIMVGLIQLVGRARRGGTPGEIYLVDDAFFDPSGRSDLPSLVGRIRNRWQAAGELDRLLSLYGPTLQAFFDFADRMGRTTSHGDHP
ncbi:hypothetical protein ACTMTI_53455 [Nonomuraea sp. H19]|uniref:hypothetical protein n=1 Tax=Nonomuraea sp. H19 TaxID=3452206 RepID=UPI003F8C1E42